MEIIALISFGYLGSTFSSSRIMKIIFSLAFVIIMVVIWGSFFAPNANYRLIMPWLFVGKLILLLMPSFIMLYRRNFIGASIYSIIVISHLVVATIQNEM